MRIAENTIFEEIRARVPLEQAARDYGVRFGRGGMVHCPFHGADRHPSMKLYPNGFQCFTCGEHGDVIDLTAKLLGLTPIAAAKELNSRYGLGLTIGRAATPQERRKQRQAAAQRRKKQALTQAWDDWKTRTWVVMSGYYRQLGDWREQYAPQTPDDLTNLDPRFLEAVRKRDYIGCCLDRLDGGDMNRQISFYRTHKDEVKKFEQRLRSDTETESRGAAGAFAGNEAQAVPISRRYRQQDGANANPTHL